MKRLENRHLPASAANYLGNFDDPLNYGLFAQVLHSRHQMTLGRDLTVQHTLPFRLLVRLLVDGAPAANILTATNRRDPIPLFAKRLRRFEIPADKVLDDLLLVLGKLQIRLVIRRVILGRVCNRLN